MKNKTADYSLYKDKNKDGTNTVPIQINHSKKNPQKRIKSNWSKTINVWNYDSAVPPSTFKSINKSELTG